MKILLLSTAAAAALCGASAQAADSTVDQLVVTATRTPERADRVGSQITVLTRAEIEARQTPLVAELLRTTPGVGMTRNGGPGGATQIRIRGAETEHTLFLIDGVKLNDPSDVGSGFNPTDLLAGDVERIEVLRGSQSVLWGSQAIGGVVNVITAEPQAAFETAADLEGGSLGTAYGRLAAGGKGERLSWRGNVAYYTTGGVSQFAAGRERDGYHDLGASGRAKAQVADQLTVEVRGAYTKSRNAFDGFAPPSFTFGDTAEFGRSQEWIGYAGANLGLLDGRFANRAAFAYTETDRVTFNPTQPAPFDRTFDAVGRNRRWEYQGTLKLQESWSAVFGAEAERSSMRSASAFSSDRFRAGLEGVYADLRLHLADGLTLGGGLRHDHHREFGGHTVAQASAAWSLNDGATVLRASWGEGFKAPSLYQLGSQYGNRALRPEQSTSWDAGLEQRALGERLVFSAAWFQRRTRDQIDFVSCFGNPAALCVGPTGPRQGVYDNLARTRAKGVELQGRAELGAGFALVANYTWTQALNDAPASPNYRKRLARRPAHAAYAELTYQVADGVSAALAARYTSSSFDDAANRNRVKGATVADVRVSYRLSAQTEVYGRVENLFDKTYQLIRNYGQPGRAVYVGLRARF